MDNGNVIKFIKMILVHWYCLKTIMIDFFFNNKNSWMKVLIELKNIYEKHQIKEQV